jgi:response regulator RpfG family c-di-GMP phosphodiesterase
MQPYALMMQIDPDDRYITESTMDEMSNNIPVQYITSIADLDKTIVDFGQPVVILVNDQGSVQGGPSLVKKIKSNPLYSHIPVVILGEVTSSEYIQQCYRAGANTFIIKPSSVADTRTKISTFFSYWFDVAEV